MGEVKYKKKFNAIQLHGKTLKGLTKFLPKLFYPAYTYFKATNNNRSGDDTKTSYSHEGTKYKKIKGSMTIGRGFDKAVTDCVKLLAKYRKFMKLEAFIDPNWIKPYVKSMTPADVRKLKQLNNRRNPYFKCFVTLMKKKKCIPVAEQVPVGNNSLGIGTLVDVVVWDTKEGKYRCTENKTGFENYLEKSSGSCMLAPFNDQPDHALNQHHLQLGITHELYKSTFPAHKVGEPMLLRFHSSGVDEYTRPDWIKKNVNKMIKKITDYNK